MPTTFSWRGPKETQTSTGYCHCFWRPIITRHFDLTPDKINYSISTTQKQLMFSQITILHSAMGCYAGFWRNKIQQWSYMTPDHTYYNTDRQS